MKKLKDFEGQKIAIHFPTYELWLRRKEINPTDTCKDRFWKDLKEKTGYSLLFSGDSGGFANIDFYKREGCTTLPATDFLEEEFIYGQEYEFSDDENFLISKKLFFVGKIENDDFIGRDKKNKKLFRSKHARKINTEHSEAITTAKELIAKFDIKQEELFND